MKKLYSIKSINGQHLCYQVADSAKEAVSFAKMYGFISAVSAKFVREN